MQRQSGQNTLSLKMELLSEKLSTVQIVALVYSWAYTLTERPAEDAVIQSRMNDSSYHHWLLSIVDRYFGHVVPRLLGFHSA
jgi:hypothetical protein